MRRAAAVALLAGYSGFLLWFATRPGEELPWMEFFWDKLRHAAAFAVVGVLALGVAGFPRLSVRKCARRGAWSLLYALAIGIAIEWAQSRVPGRQPERADVVADLLGAAAAVFAAVMFLRRKERLQRAAHS